MNNLLPYLYYINNLLPYLETVIQHLLCFYIYVRNCNKKASTKLPPPIEDGACIWYVHIDGLSNVLRDSEYTNSKQQMLNDNDNT